MNYADRIEALIAKLEKADKLDDLDEMIHEAFASQAAIVNNDGPHEQIRWLMANGSSLKELEETLDPKGKP